MKLNLKGTADGRNKSNQSGVRSGEVAVPGLETQKNIRISNNRNNRENIKHTTRSAYER